MGLRNLLTRSAAIVGVVLVIAACAGEYEPVGRWHFASQSNALEWQRKQDKLKQIDAFWIALKHDRDVLRQKVDANDKSALDEWATQHIKNIHSELGHRFQKTTNVYLLTLDTSCEPALGPMVETLIERYTAVADWSVVHRKDDELATRIPEQPYFMLESDSRQQRIDLRARDAGRLTIATKQPEIYSPIRNEEEVFPSRYSKFGERFAYLQIDSAPFLVAHQKELERLAAELGQTLRQSKLGCDIGYGIGRPDIAYIDLMLADADKAAPVIQQFTRAHNLPVKSWLRFYDADWKAEWVGMYDDTPSPDQSVTSEKENK